jgi:uncharacterized membrane protein
MFPKIKNLLFNTYAKVISSIAFYPTLISVALLFSAIGLLSFEDNKMTQFLLDKAPFLVINNSDTARSILSTLIGGIISLTVFSFSMVMVLLNQASSNFSPRLLPGLISDKRNQIVLGFYIGTLVYNIIVLMSILPGDSNATIDGFSILVGIVLGIMCLGLFVFFIHSISTNIQIGHILEEIFNKTQSRLEVLIKKERQEGYPIEADISQWEVLKSSKTGFFRSINLEGLKTAADNLDIDIVVTALKGEYILQNMEIMRYSKPLEEQEKERLEGTILYAESSLLENNYTLGFTQIGEVGIKAMSPGINDPGTAVITLDYLTELFALRLKLDDAEFYRSKEKNKYVEHRSADFEDLIYQNLAAYRQYCKHDIILMQKIAEMLKYLKYQSQGAYTEIIQKQLDILKEDIEKSITNKYDREKALKLIES